MAAEPWKSVRDYVTLQRGKTYSGKLVGAPGPALLGLGSIEPGGGFRADKYKTFGGDCPPSLMVSPGDIYVALKGATKDGSMVGSVARLPGSVASGRLTQDTARLDFVERNPWTVSHLYWVLRTPHYRQYCAGRLTGSAAASFSRQDFLSYPVPPVTSTSRAIVSLLEAIEAKIELNRRTNETLEAIARALFKSWFVDFDPVRAKSEGRDPALPPHVADLFPGSFENSELGEIPKGWRVMAIANLAAVNLRTLDRTDRLDVIDYIEISEVTRGQVENVVRYERGTEPSRARRRLAHGDTVISTVRPDRGSYFLSLSPSETLVVSTAFAVASPRDGNWAFLYSALTRPEVGDELGRLADGGAYPAVRPEAITGLRLVSPQLGETRVAYDAVARPLYERSEHNRIENRLLVSVRDTLLPKLISGELRADAARGTIVP